MGEKFASKRCLGRLYMHDFEIANPIKTNRRTHKLELTNQQIFFTNSLTYSQNIGVH